MIDCGGDDLVLLSLLERGADERRARRSSLSIATALDLEETVAARVSLLSTLTSLEREGFLERSRAAIDGKPDERTVYGLTDAGRRRATDLRERLREETLAVHEGGERRCHRLGDVPETYDLSLVAALAKRSPDGELYLEEDLETELVGRERERERLRAGLRAARSGRGRVIAVTGEAGCGKTALVDRLLADARTAGVAAAVGRCQREGGAPYQPFRAALERLADDSDDLPFEGGPAAGHAPGAELRGATLFSRVVDWLGERAEARPHVLVLEDLQWADAATLGLLAYAADRVASEGVCLVWSCRTGAIRDDERLSELLAESDHLEVGPLDREAVSALVEQRVGRRGVPSTFVDAVFERTGGNPLFVGETVTALLEDGAVCPERDAYPERGELDTLPEAVGTTIRGRLERLDDETREVLECGAVIGDRVPFAALAAASERSTPQLRAHVDALVDGRIWRSDGERAVRFASEVLRSTAYDGIDSARRRRIHRRVAAVTAAEAATDAHAAIAHHALCGGDDEMAIDHSIAAGERASAVYAYDAAIGHYERALHLAREQDRTETVLEVLETLGDIYYTRGEYEEADKHVRYVRERADDPERIRRTYRYQARMRFERGEYEAAERYATAGLAVGDDDDTVERCWLEDYLAGSRMKRGRLEEAVEGFRTQRTLAKRLGDDLLLGRTYQNLGICYQHRGETARAVGALEHGASLLEGAGDDRELARCLNDLAITYDRAGDHRTATTALERCRDLAEETGNARVTFLARTTLGAFARYRGEWDEASDHYERVRSLAARADNDEYAAFALANEGFVAAETASLVDALSKFDRALEVLRDLELQYHVAGQLVARGDLLVLRGEFTRARRSIDEGLEIARENGYKRWVAAGERARGTVRRERGDPVGALEEQRRALALAEEAGVAREVAEHRWQLGETLLRAGRPDEAFAESCRARTALPAEYRVARAKADVTRGAAYRAREEYDAARRHLESAFEDVEALSTEATVRARRELGLVAVAQGAPSVATAQLEAGRALAAEIEATLYVDRFDELLSGLGEAVDPPTARD